MPNLIAQDCWFSNLPIDSIVPKDIFSARVGYLGGYALGLAQSQTLLTKLRNNAPSQFKMFYRIIADSDKQLDWAMVTTLLTNVSKSNLNIFDEVALVESEALREFTAAPANAEDLPRSTGLLFPSGKPTKIFPSPADFDPAVPPWYEPVGHASDELRKLFCSGDYALSTDFSVLFQTQAMDNGKTKWIGQDAVNIEVWREWFGLGSCDGKKEAIVQGAHDFIEDVAHKLVKSGFSETGVKFSDLKDSSKRLAKAHSLDERNVEIAQLEKVAAPQNFHLTVDEELMRDKKTATKLLSDFQSELTEMNALGQIFKRQTFLCKLQTIGEENLELEYVTDFYPLRDDAVETNALNLETARHVSDEFLRRLPWFKSHPYRARFQYRTDVAAPADELLVFLKGALSNEVNLLSVEKTVDLLNTAYVAGICAAYSMALTWHGNQDLVDNVAQRSALVSEINDQIDALLDDTAKSLYETGGIDTPLKHTRLWYAMGFRALEQFAILAVDEAAMAAGANAVLNALREELPGFFKQGNFSTLEEALSYVHKASHAVSQTLLLQETKIKSLEQTVTNLQNELKKATEELLEKTEIIKDLQAQLQEEQKQEQKLQNDLKVAIDSAANIQRYLDDANRLISELAKISASNNKSAVVSKLATYAGASALFAGPAGALLLSQFGPELKNVISGAGGALADALGDAWDNIGGVLGSLF